MISRNCAILLFAMAASVIAPPAFAQDSTPSHRFITITVSGSPYERGVQQGRQLHDEIAKGILIWKKNLTGIFGVDADLFIKDFLAQTNYLPAIRKWTPELLDEVRGIAAGSGIDFKTILAFQLMDEYWVNGPELKHEHCSAIARAGAGAAPMIVAQNMDLESFRNGFQTILHIREKSGLEELVLTQPGLIAFNGMNSRGVAVNTNTLAQLAHSRDGLPVAFIVRGILERKTFTDARAFVKTVPHASGQNYTIGGPGKVAYFEASAKKVVEVPGATDRFLFHTNHPIVNNDYSAEGAREMAKPDLSDNSHTRYHTLEVRLTANKTGNPLQVIEDTLRSRDSETYPVSRPWKPGAAFFTYSSTIMVLSGNPHLIASPGPPAQNPYVVFNFDQTRR